MLTQFNSSTPKLMSRADNLTAICEPIVGSLDVSQPYGPSRPVTGTALPYLFPNRLCVFMTYSARTKVVFKVSLVATRVKFPGVVAWRLNKWGTKLWIIYAWRATCSPWIWEPNDPLKLLQGKTYFSHTIRSDHLTEYTISHPKGLQFKFS
jgi:hypothetical protein